MRSFVENRSSSVTSVCAERKTKSSARGLSPLSAPGTVMAPSGPLLPAGGRACPRYSWTPWTPWAPSRRCFPGPGGDRSPRHHYQRLELEVGDSRLSVPHPFLGTSSSPQQSPWLGLASDLPRRQSVAAWACPALSCFQHAKPCGAARVTLIGIHAYKHT